jgi:transcriptional regulator with XRE-family HTH domain
MSTDNSGQTCSVGNRIREERKRLGLSQDAFAKIVGVHRRTQINYESGEREPDTAYLEAISKAGIDVSYVLTGDSGELKQKALWHVLQVIQEFLQLIAYDKEFEDAIRLAADEHKAFWSTGISETKADNAILALLKKSPVLVLDQWLFEDMLEKLEFVLETKKLTLSSTAKARAIMHLYKEIQVSRQRVELKMVEAAIEKAI